MSSILEAAWAWVWGGGSLSKLALVDFSLQWGLWMVAALLKTEKFYDLAG